jgi:signal peptidase
VATGVLLFVVGLTLSGHRMTTVLTGSMAPQLAPGTLVVTERVSASDVRTGDVVVFPRPGHEGETVIHRVVSITPTGDGALQAHTKGDANTAEDPWVLRVSPDTRVDRGVAAFANIGQDIARARQVAIEVFIILVSGSILWYGMRRLWSK